MTTNFKNIKQLFDFFKDEETCRTYLEHQRWGGNPVCPHCLTEQPYRTNRGFKCRNKECYKKFSVTVGTIFENSKISLRTWFAAIYLCTSSKKGVSSLQASRQLGVTQKTAWFILHRVREMLRAKAPHMLTKEVQVDETYVGGKEKNKHPRKRTPRTEENKNGGAVKNSPKTPVLGLCETGGNVVAIALPWVTRKNVSNIINSVIAPNATMVTDGYGVYTHLTSSLVYNHKVVNHAQGEYVKDGFHTNSVEGFFGLLKRGIYGIYHQVSVKHLQRYCDEFASRYNSRKTTDDVRFEDSVKGCAGRLKYNALIGK